MGSIACCSKGENERGLHLIKTRSYASVITDSLTYEELRNHKLDGDDKTLNLELFSSLNNPYEIFEKKFPFFRMDVNGYCLHVREAIVKDLKADKKDVRHLHHKTNCVSLASLQETFKPFESWAELNDTNSNFVKLLIEECSVDATVDLDATKDKEAKDIWFDCFRLKVMGILWCKGSKKEKILEVYNVLQANHDKKIAHNDKENKPTFYAIFDLSTELVFKHAKRDPLLAQKLKHDITAERIKEVKETYHDVLEDFLDEVFGHENKESRIDWQTQVFQKHSWVVVPQDVRVKLYPETRQKKRLSTAQKDVKQLD